MQQKRAQKIDKIIGRNIRIHRLAKKMSQTELGDQLGVSFQQVQKYECGAHNIPARRLWMLAQTLQVPIAYFFDPPNGT